ncbi:MAG: TRAP transporter small permease [Verrucomicrobiota bacterium JB022]|nr:TRAP transporter small permease [Verrucomicrobiota bacterium JB022]
MSTASSPSFLSRGLNVLAAILNFLLIVSMALLVLAVLWGVVSRYVLGSPSSWTEPLATYLLMWVSLLGAAVVFRERGHLGVDYFMTIINPNARRIAKLAAELIVMSFAGYVMVYGGSSLVSRALATGETVAGLGMLLGPIYLAIPISGVFFMLFGIEHLVEWAREPKLAEAEPVHAIDPEI